jgi:hypothetical protein
MFHWNPLQDCERTSNKYKLCPTKIDRSVAGRLCSVADTSTYSNGICCMQERQKQQKLALACACWPRQKILGWLGETTMCWSTRVCLFWSRQDKHLERGKESTNHTLLCGVYLSLSVSRVYVLVRMFLELLLVSQVHGRCSQLRVWCDPLFELAYEKSCSSKRFILFVK